MKKFAVIGNPIDHSLSPIIHQQFAKQFSMEIQYRKLFSEINEFEENVNTFFRKGGLGMNVTLPFKHRAYKMAKLFSKDFPTPLEAVNTLALDIKTNQLIGDNTDGRGFVDDINKKIGTTLKNSRLLILGCGGAVSGILPAVILEDSNVSIWARNKNTIDQAIQKYKGVVQQVEYPDCEKYDIVINAISFNANISFLEHYISSKPFYYDLSYTQDRSHTAFIQLVVSKGVTHFSDGLGMLIAQAAHSFYIWNKKKPNVELISI